MIPFKPVELNDLPQIKRALKWNISRGCSFSLPNIFIWRRHFSTCFTILEDCLVISLDCRKKVLFPVGERPFDALEQLRKQAKAEGRPLVIISVCPEQRKLLEQYRPGQFQYEENRDYADYLYEQESLATLRGKKLHNKRNHINRFSQLYQWSYESMSEQNIPDCLAMHAQWCQLNDDGCDPLLTAEGDAVRDALTHFNELGMRGGVLNVQNRGVVAFTLGAPVCADTFDVCIEKAFYDVEGAYSVINQLFAQRECDGFTYLNREEDMGVEGLRKSKLSYQPALLLTKYTARLEE